MIEAFSKTLKEIFTPFFLGIVLLNLIITASFFFLLIWGAGELAIYYADSYDLLKYVVGAGVVILVYFLFPVIFPLFSYLFQDVIASKLNKKYNISGQKFETPMLRVVFFAIKFTTLSLILNLVLLPLYFIPLIGFLVFFSLNSYLLGREYYHLSAISLIESDKINKFRKDNFGKFLVMGIAIATFFLIPIFNLLAPLVSVVFSWFYIFEIIRKTNKQP